MSKIDKLKLGPKIQELVVSGETSRDKIAQILCKESGVKISGSTVGRYLQKIKSTAKESAFDTIREHVGKVVPDDLDALELMENTCLSWVKEASRDKVQRVAEAALVLPTEISAWIANLSSLPPDLLVEWMIKRCLFHLTRDDTMQDSRLKAMRQATSIIELKLRQAGLLDPDVHGQVVIVDRSSEYYEKLKQKAQGVEIDSGRSLMVINGGNRQDES